jgi:thioredoxin-like negative regulator of GroEL
MTDHLSRAHQLLASGQLDEARIYLEELLRDDQQNTDLLCDLGLCYVNLSQLDNGIELLHRSSNGHEATWLIGAGFSVIAVHRSMNTTI